MDLIESTQGPRRERLIIGTRPLYLMKGDAVTSHQSARLSTRNVLMSKRTLRRLQWLILGVCLLRF